MLQLISVLTSPRVETSSWNVLKCKQTLPREKQMLCKQLTWSECITETCTE